MIKNKNKEIVFICLSCISIGSLFGSFAGNLEKFEVYQQGKNEVFVITENNNLPYGLDKKNADLLASKYNSDLLQKCLLLGIAGISATTALLLANINFEELELNWEVSKIENTAKKQLTVEKIKHRYALMSLAQKEQFRLEISSLLELTGGDETLLASEVNVTDKFLNIGYLIAEGHSLDMAIAQTFNVQPGTREHTLKKLAYQDYLNGNPDSKYLDPDYLEDQDM